MTVNVSFSRKLVVVLIALITGMTVLIGASTASASSSQIHVLLQPIAKNNQMFWIITDAPTGTPLEVWVNGKRKGTVALRTHSTGEDYINYNKAWGLGTFQLRDGTTASKPVRMLAAVKLRPYTLKRVGLGAKQLRVKVTAKRYHPGKNKWVKAPRPILQVKSGKWKTVKKVKLNKKGKGMVTLKPAKAFKYRIVVKKTKKNARTFETSFGKI